MMRLAPLPLAIMSVFLAVQSGCAAATASHLPDQASTDAPPDASQILVLPTYPVPGKKYLVDRDGQQELWVVKDGQGTIDFVEQPSQRTKLTIKLGPCFSFALLQGPRDRVPHDFGAMGTPAFHTVPPDCKAWDGRTWTQTYAVKMPRYRQPCYYEAKRKATVEGAPGRRLVRSESSVDITGPGIRGVQNAQYRIVFSEELQFFKELSPGYIGSRALVLQELK